MKTTLYPSLEEALHLHQRLIETFGGIHGIRDIGLLESALARPKSGYYKSLSQQAGALFHSIINNHCFVDGNKRLAFSLAVSFLKLNRVSVKVRAKEAERFIIDKAIAKKVDAQAIGKWLEMHFLKVGK